MYRGHTEMTRDQKSSNIFIAFFVQFVSQSLLKHTSEKLHVYLKLYEPKV